jgi:hypothetical protein
MSKTKTTQAIEAGEYTAYHQVKYPEFWTVTKNDDYGKVIEVYTGDSYNPEGDIDDLITILKQIKKLSKKEEK